MSTVPYTLIVCIHRVFVMCCILSIHPDVIGVVKSTADVTSITTRQTNRKVSKRDLQLMDRSERVVQLTLWGAEAEGFDGSTNPVLAIRGAKVSDFGGVCEPYIPQVYRGEQCRRMLCNDSGSLILQVAR